tara:strand:- start:186 stop:443 length:258 start_codon:yes stop_codon:yes gene_type:complete
MNTTQIKKLVGNKIFSATFIKKNGELRKMLCRLGVKKHLKGGIKKYDAESLNMITVYSLDSKGYRTLSLSSLKQIKSKGTTINFK